MKKLMFLSFLVLTLSIVSGCGREKILTCTKSEDSVGMTMNQNIITTFKGNKLTKINMSIDVIVDDQYKSQIETIESSLKSQFSNYENQKGITFKTSSKDKTVNLNIIADLKNIDSKTKEKLEMAEAGEKYKNVKADFENDGYKCK